MKKPSKRWILLVIVGLPLVLVGLGVALVLAFPAERVGRIAAERASAALDRDVTVERVGFTLWPAPAVALEGVTIARWRNSRAREADSTNSAATRPLAQIARVEVRPRLLPLIRRDLRVDEIVIVRPAFVIEADGSTDPVPESVREGSTGFWDDATFQIERIRVRDGSIEYRDADTGGVATIDGIDQELTLDGELVGGELARLALRGSIAADSVDIDMPDRLATPIHDLQLSIEHDAVLDLSTETAIFDRLEITLQEMVLEGSGTVESWSDPASRRVSLRLESSDADVASLIASLPAELRSWPAGATTDEEWSAVAGRGRVAADIDGRLGDGEMPTVDGTLTLNDVALARGGDPVISGLSGLVAFSLESASSEGITAGLLGEPLRLTFDVRDLAAPVVTGTLATRLDLAKLAAVGLLPPDWTATGAPSIDLAIEGPILEPAAVSVDGTVSLAGVRMGSPDWPAPIAISGGGLEFTGAEMVGRGLSATIGESDVTLDFALADWLPYVLGDADPVPVLAFETRSRLLDADVLLPVDPAEPTYAELFFARLANTPINGMSAAAAAEAAGLTLPELPRVVIEGSMHADRIVQRGLTYENVDIALASREGQLELRSADFDMFGGQVQLAARLGASGDAAATASATATATATTMPLSLDFSLQDISADPFLQRFTAFRDHVTGSLALDGSLTMALDEHLLPHAETLSGGGRLAVLGGRLANWPMVQALGDRLGIARFDTIAFEDWTGGFDMIGSRIVLQETVIGGGDLRMAAAGSFDVGGELDLAGTAYLGPDLTSRVRGTEITALVEAMSGSDGEVPIGVHVSGTTRQPSVRLDLSEAGSRLAERARAEAEARARELAAEAAGELVGAERIPAVESPAAAIDSVRQRVGDAVVGRLRGLMRSREEPSDSDVSTPSGEPAPDSTTAAAVDSTRTR